MGNMMKTNVARAGAVAIAACLAACCALALAGCGSTKAEEQPAKVSAIARADGWVKGTSSSAVVVFYDKDGKAVMSHALDCNDAAEFEVPGTATAAKVVSPIDADGSAYAPAAAITIEPKSGETVAAAVELAPKTAEATTAADLETILHDLGEAAKVGDATMAGDAGKAVIELAKRNAGANPNADKTKIEEAAAEAEESAAATEAVQASGDSGGSSGGSSSGGSSSGGGSAPAGHTHTWATRYVVDTAAWTEEIYHPMEGEQHTEYYDKCTVCGADITADPAGHIHSAHSGTGSWATAGRTVTTIYHEAYTEYVEHPESGHTETYCTGCGAVQ